MESSLQLLVGITVFFTVFFAYPTLQRRVGTWLNPKKRRPRYSSSAQPLALSPSKTTPLGSGSLEELPRLRRTRL